MSLAASSLLLVSSTRSGTELCTCQGACTALSGLVTNKAMREVSASLFHHLRKEKIFPGEEGGPVICPKTQQASGSDANGSLCGTPNITLASRLHRASQLKLLLSRF